MSEYGVIYCWINQLNGMMYVGQTNNITKRLHHYKKNTHINQRKLYNATRKYGWDNFRLEIIEEDIPKLQLNEREIFWIDYLHTFDTHDNRFGYNLTSGGGAPEFISNESRAKMSKANSGEKHYLFGKTASDATRAKMSSSRMGKIFSKETRAKMSGSGRLAQIRTMKPVECIETGIKFESVRACARHCEINVGNLHRHLKGKLNHVEGSHFRYITS